MEGLVIDDGKVCDYNYGRRDWLLMMAKSVIIITVDGSYS